MVYLLLLAARCGGVEAATFCALMTLYDALHHEACVDIYTVSKLYSMKRPDIWSTEVQYVTTGCISRFDEIWFSGLCVLVASFEA